MPEHARTRRGGARGVRSRDSVRARRVLNNFAAEGTETDGPASNLHIAHELHGRILMTTPGGGALTTDFELMTAVAGKTDRREGGSRGILQAFIGPMGSVPPSVWGGVAAARFRDVVERWNAESMKLHA